MNNPFILVNLFFIPVNAYFLANTTGKFARSMNAVAVLLNVTVVALALAR